jgi:hypothetical protein
MDSPRWKYPLPLIDAEMNFLPEHSARAKREHVVWQDGYSEYIGYSAAHGQRGQKRTITTDPQAGCGISLKGAALAHRIRLAENSSAVVAQRRSIHRR